MLHHAADQLHVEVTHVEYTPSGLAHNREGLHKNFIQNFLERCVLFFLELFGAVKIIFRFGLGHGVRCRAAGDMAQPLLNTLAELVGFRAQFIVGELLHLRLESINRFDPGH